MTKPKLSAKATDHIQEAISQLDKGIAFIMQSETHIVCESPITNLPEYQWRNGTGKQGGAINKQIGSELCCLYNARQRLQWLITPVTVEPS